MSIEQKTIYLIGDRDLTADELTSCQASGFTCVSTTTLAANEALRLPCAMLTLCRCGDAGCGADISQLTARLSQEEAGASDRLLLYLRSRLLSSTSAVESTVKLVELALKHFVKVAEHRQVVLVLQEALRNALEHGNCAISANEKVQAIEAEGFDRLVNERSAIAQHCGKRIKLDVRVSKTLLEFEIEDEGAGFDWRTVLAGLDVSNLADAVSGRGLLLAQMLFDERIYNESGNCVLLRKRLS